MEHHLKSSEASLINHTRDKSKQPKAATLLYHTQSAPGGRTYKCEEKAQVSSSSAELGLQAVDCSGLLFPSPAFPPPVYWLQDKGKGKTISVTGEETENMYPSSVSVLY